MKCILCIVHINNINKFGLFICIIYILVKLFQIQIKNEIALMENYYNLCIQGNSLTDNNFIKILQPNISIVSTIYNKQDYIPRFLRSIQNQNFTNIEIILVDDCSTDESVNVVKKYQMEDQRIFLIQNKINKGTLISRNIGIFLSIGIYIMIPDIDDIYSSNILNDSFLIAENYDYDIIRFKTYLGNRHIFMNKQIKHLKSEPIYQPDLSNYIFYGLGHLEIFDPTINNKLIKREILIKTLNSIEEFYLNKNMIFYEDTLINIMLHRKAKSLYFLNKIGYYYICTPHSSTKEFVKNNLLSERFLYSLFLFLQFIYFQTKNTKFEKSVANEFINKEMNLIFSLIHKVSGNQNFYINIINLLYFETYSYLSLKLTKKIQNDFSLL